MEGKENKKNYNLSKIIGIGAKDNFSFSINKQNGIVAYISGPFITFYDIRKDTQTKFLQNKNNKSFSSVTFSDKGNLIACGEGRFKKPEIIIYDLTNEAINISDKIKYVIKGHKCGIEMMEFFKNDQYLISIGNSDDKNIYVWQLLNTNSDNNYISIFSTKFKRPILAFSVSNNFFVLGGSQFLKIWTLDEIEKKIINKSSVELGKLRDKVISALLISEERIFGMTSDAFLIEINCNNKQITRYLHLKAEKGITLCSYDNLLVCGCSDGVIRIFKTENLSHVITLHRPPPLGKANIDASVKKINISVTNDEKFADVIALKYNANAEKLISIYSDKTFFVWDLKNSEKIYVFRYNTFHSGTICQMDILQTKDNIIRIATCSDDKTVRFWNFKIEDFLPNLKIGEGRKINHIAYSKYIRHIFYFGKSLEHFKKSFDLREFADEATSNLYDEDQIKYVKFSPDENYMACGDQNGVVYIYKLDNSFELHKTIPAHNLEITSMDFVQYENTYLLSTGSQDGLIHIFSVNKNFEFTTISEHEGAIRTVKFAVDKTLKSNNIKFLSCGADNQILFFSINGSKNPTCYHRFQEENLKVYDLALNPDQTKMIAGHNGKISIWDIGSAFCEKILEMKSGSIPQDNFRVAIDQTGVYMAMSCNDKYVRVRNIINGQLISKIPCSEFISSIHFSINNEYLIISSIEGFVNFFKIELNTNVLLNQSAISSPEHNIQNKDVHKTNRMKILERFINFKDNNESPVLQNDKISQLLEKLKNNTEFKMEDLTFLESLSLNFSNNELEQRIKEEKDKNNNDGVNFTNQINFDNKLVEENEKEKHVKNSQVINLGEEPAANIEEEINDKDENNEQKLYLTKSKVYETNMREIDKYTNESIKRSLVQQNVRNSLSNTYLKNKDQKGNDSSPQIKNSIPINVFSKVKQTEKTENTVDSILSTNNQNSVLNTNPSSNNIKVSHIAENSQTTVNNSINDEKNLANIKKQKEKQIDKDKNLSDLLGIINNANKYVDEVNTRYISTSNELTKKDLRQNNYTDDQLNKDTNTKQQQLVIKSNKPSINLATIIDTKKNINVQETNSKKLGIDRQEKSPVNNTNNAVKTDELTDAKTNFYKMIEFTEKKQNLFQIQEDEILEEDFDGSTNMFIKSTNDHHLEVSDTVTGFKKKDELQPQNFLYSNNSFPLNHTESSNNVTTVNNPNRETISEYNKSNIIMTLGSKSIEEMNRNLERMIGEYKLFLVNNKCDKNESVNELKTTLNLLSNFTRIVDNKLNEIDPSKSVGEGKIDNNLMRELLEVYSEKLVTKVELLLKNKK